MALKTIRLLIVALFFESCVSTSTVEKNKVGNAGTNDQKTSSNVSAATSGVNKVGGSVEKTSSLQTDYAESSSPSEVMGWIEQKNWSQLKRYCYEILESKPNHNKSCWTWLGLISFYENKNKLARYYFARALEKNEDKYIIYNNLALVHLQEKNPGEALKMLRLAVIHKGNQRSPFAEINMALLFAGFKDYRKALVALDQVSLDKVNDSVLLNNFAVIYMVNDRMDQAEKFFKKALSLDGNNKQVILNYAIFNIHHKKNFDQGRKLLDQLLFLGVESDMQRAVSDLEKKLEEARR